MLPWGTPKLDSADPNPKVSVWEKDSDEDGYTASDTQVLYTGPA